MAVQSEFATFCCELLSDLGPVRAKRMFGGYGFSVDGLTVAIAANLGDGERLYLKANEASKPQFVQADCVQFTYEAKGELKLLNYYAPPEDAMESPALMQPWARLAWTAAVQAQAAKPAAKLKVKPNVAVKVNAKIKAKVSAKAAAAKPVKTVKK
jgi:DNA transformation protein and related proteins